MASFTDIIIQDFDLRLPPEHSEEEMLRMLTLRVTEMLAGDIDLLMSYLYRLDVLEKDLNAALQPGSPIPPNQALAQLILDRQKARVETKRNTKVEPIEEGWEF